MRQMDIEEIQDVVRVNKMQFSKHAIKQLDIRNIKKQEVYDCLFSGKIIKEYADDRPLPSCLILGYQEDGTPLHIVCAKGEGDVVLITAYYPSEEVWDSDFVSKRRV